MIKTTLLLFTLLTNSIAFANKTYLINDSQISFKATGKPGFIRINGEKGKATGSISIADNTLSAEIFSDLDLFVTGLELRDQHMKDNYLETKKFPKSSIKIDKLQFSQNSEQDFSGSLNLHGVTKNIVGKTKILETDKKISINAHFNILLSDFSINIPEYLGIKVADKVDIIVEIHGETK